jgi:hypothetical protein
MASPSSMSAPSHAGCAIRLLLKSVTGRCGSRLSSTRATEPPLATKHLNGLPVGALVIEVQSIACTHGLDSTSDAVGHAISLVRVSKIVPTNARANHRDAIAIMVENNLWPARFRVFSTKSTRGGRTPLRKCARRRVDQSCLSAILKLLNSRQLRQSMHLTAITDRKDLGPRG